MDRKYWASAPADEVGKHIIRRFEQYSQFLDTSGHYQLVSKAYRAYYGLSDDGFSSHNLKRGGEAGELTKIKINHLRSVLQTVFNMATKEKLAFNATAKGTDSESLSQQQFAEGLIDEYITDKDVGKRVKDGAELALATTEGWLIADWDETVGDEVRPDENGQMIQAGDAYVCTKSVLDVARDTHRKDGDLPWIIIHHEKNKWDLAAANPALADKILGQTERNDSKVKRMVEIGNIKDSTESDLISVFEFRHRVTPALRKGRRVTVLADGTVLKESEWEWPTVKAHVIAPAPLHLTPLNYSPAFDIGAIQDALDIVYSSVLTNARTFGVQNVWSKKGDGLTVTQLTSGLNHYQTLEQKPEGINLTEIPQALFSVLDKLGEDLQLLSGVNSVSRGEPPSGVTAGNALALLASQAMQFNDNFQESIYNASEQLATDILELIQRYAQADRESYIKGKNRRNSYQTYNASKVERVVGFKIERVNPLLKTAAGRSEIANRLFDSQAATPEQYLDFISTGRLEPLLGSRRTKFQHVQSENDLLKQGVKPSILVTDDPILHIQEHDSVLHSPEARENPAVVAATLAHLQEHGVAWQTLWATYPEMAAALKIPPPPAMAPPTPQTDPSAAPGQQPTGGVPDQPEQPTPAVETADGQQVQLPTNPLTGETFNPAEGV